jgi:hypothetical protein
VDLGVNWLAPWPFEPRLCAGWPFGSGDRSPESGSDESFRQTGLQANEAGFAGVQRFAHCGARLDPELTGVDRDLGHGIDVVLAVEEWSHVELELAGAALRAGDAFGTHEGRWEVGGYPALRVDF